MKTSLTQILRSTLLITLLFCAAQLAAPAPAPAPAPIPVRFQNGTIHGFLELRSDDGKVIASGDLVQVASGGTVTGRLLFTFKDGSIDDETTVFSQRRTFRLITDHHIQKGPFFPHPIDLMIDARSGKVTVHSTGKDGKDEVKTSQMQLPPDLANGIVSNIIQNLQPGAAETKIPLLAATPEPRLVTLSIASRGEEPFSLAGATRKSTHYEIKIELGGVAGIVAPMIGHQPPNIQVWVIGAPAPSFLREQGPLYADGPVLTMQLASPTWPDSSHTGN